MQSALRDEGLAWACYELNHAVRLALTGQRMLEAWQAGENVFSAAQIAGIEFSELAETFDAAKSLGH